MPSPTRADARPRRRARSRSLACVVRDYGGIHPDDSAFLAFCDGVREATERGVPLYVFRRDTRSGLDCLAREIAASGHFIPDDPDRPADTLWQMLCDGAEVDADDDTRYADAAEADAECAEHLAAAARSAAVDDFLFGPDPEPEPDPEPANPWRQDSQLDLFGGRHARPRPGPDTWQPTLMAADVERELAAAGMLDTLATFGVGSDPGSDPAGSDAGVTAPGSDRLTPADIVSAIDGRRVDLGYSHAHLARLSGVSQPTAQRVCAGDREPSLAAALAMLDALGLDVVIRERPGHRPTPARPRGRPRG